MALDWGKDLNSPKKVDPTFAVFYAGAKSGKTTLASEFPYPYHCRTGDGEDTPTGVTMPSYGVSETFEDIINQMDWMLEGEHDRRTFVLDAADGLEVLIEAEACRRNGWASVSDGQFGAGGVAVRGLWDEFVKKCLKLKRSGYYVVILAHVKAKTVPGVTTDSYPRYMPNLHDSAVGALVDASDLIGFLHQRVTVVKEKAGFHKDNVRTRGAGGGDIVIAVQERPGFIAGNRYDIPEPTIPFKRGEGFIAIAKYLPKELFEAV